MLHSNIFDVSELHTLNDEELVALVGLLEYVVMEDKLLNEQEEDMVRWLMNQVGMERYMDAIEEFETRYGNQYDLRSLLETIDRHDARELIYGTVLEVSSINAVTGSESDLMDWLAELWELEIRILQE